MTRELLFTSTFESQLFLTTGWKSLNTDPGVVSPSGLAPSDFPGFVIIPGETRYTSYDSFGRPQSGVQDFTLRIFFAHPQLALVVMRATHSDDVGLIEAFFSGGFVAPLVSTGDMVRIDSVYIQKVDPAALHKNDTRSVISVHAAYYFTFL